jgi:hypothetical protein
MGVTQYRISSKLPLLERQDLAEKEGSRTDSLRYVLDVLDRQDRR